jgi:Secretory lipase
MTIVGSRRASMFVAAAMVLCAAVAGAPALASTSSGPTLPTSDPFYTYTGSSPLASIAPGTVLKQRTITIVDEGETTALSGTQVLYRTTGELGQPTVTVATVIRPSTVVPTTKIISYQMAYDALGPECDPSYTLQGGNPNGATTNEEEEQLVAAYVAAGDTAVVPDYEGTSLDWAAGQEEGYNTLDGIRATENLLKLPAATTPVAMVGYSGGSIATEFASEQASKYAPKLDLVGVAEGGVPVDFAHNTTYINGSQGWSGVIPAVLVALGRAFHLALAPYSSAYGLKISNQVKDQCINSFFGAYPGLTVQKLLKPAWQKYFFSIPQVAAVTDKLIMGRTGTPKGPLFMGVGNADGTGDGVMIANDVEALAHEYCQRGVSVQFNVYKGDSHTQAADPFEVGALQFLSERLNGMSVTNGCSSIGAGNSLTPVPLPPNLKLRYAGPSKKLGGVVVYVRAASSGTLPNLTVTLKRGRRLIEALSLPSVTSKSRKLVLRHNGHALSKGGYTVTVTQPTLTLAHKAFRIR